MPQSQTQTPTASVTATYLPPGQAGTIQTLGLMAKFVRDSQTDYAFIDFAHQILSAAKAPAHNVQAEICALYAYMKGAIVFRKDPYDAELVRDPRRTLQSGSGDCDDQATLLAALLAAVGYLPRFCVMKMNASSQDWEHVYVEVQVNGAWVPLDTCRNPAQGPSYPGWESFYKAKAVYTIFPNGVTNASGLGDDWSDVSGDPNYFDPGSDNGGDTNFDFSGSTDGGFDWNSMLNDPNYFDPGTDPNATVTPEENELFSWLQDNFGGQPLYNPSLADVGIYQSSDGSTVFVNPDGTISFQNSNGQYVGQLIDANGNAVRPATISQATAVKPQNSSSGSGGGGGIPLGSSGGQKAQTPASSSNSTQGISQLVSAISKAVTDIGKATGLVSPYANYNNLTPQQAAALQLQARNGQLSAGLSISPTTLLLIGVGILFLTKK